MTFRAKALAILLSGAVLATALPVAALAAPASIPAASANQPASAPAGLDPTGPVVADFLQSVADDQAAAMDPTTVPSQAEIAADQALFTLDQLTPPNLDGVPTDVTVPYNPSELIDATAPATASPAEATAPATTESVAAPLSTRVAGWRISSYALGLRHYGYKFGANGPYYYDCSSYVRRVYSHFGIYLPRTSSAQSRRGTFISKANLRPGDLVFFKNTYKAGVSHVGIYIGGGKFINDWPGVGTTVSSLNSSYFRSHYWGAKRVW